MRVLALDIGEKRIGVAVSDPTARIATPLTVLDALAVRRDPAPLRRLADDYEVELVLAGLPISLDGSEGPQAVRVRQEAQRLADALGVRLDFADERLSSAEASRALSASGLSAREQRGKLDAAAAAVFLQAWLDARHNAAERAGSPEGEGA